MTTNSTSHIDSLDGWRGIAILLVFLFHYLPHNTHSPFVFLGSLGWTGVDLFFVLSGFLITGILFDSRNSSNFFRSFYVRRALRLFPVYFLAVAVVIVGTGFLAGSRDWRDIPFFVYGANFVVLTHKAFFPPYFDCGHFWSLALEEQFYSLWPLVVFFVRKPQTLIRICWIGILTSLVLRIIIALVGASSLLAYYELPTRMDSLLLGALLALALRVPGHEQWLRPSRLRWIFFASVLLIIVTLSQARTLHWASVPMSSVGYSLLAAMYASILGASLVPGTLAHFIGRLRPLRFLGRYSYGLYIWHALTIPVTLKWLVYFRTYIHANLLAELCYTLAMLALFTGIAVLSYHCYEIHFLRLKSRFAPVRKSGPTEVQTQPLTAEA